MLLSRLELRDEHNKYVKFLQLNTRGRETMAGGAVCVSTLVRVGESEDMIVSEDDA